MADEKRPTVQALRDALAQLPADAEWWAYEGEVSGIIVDHPDVSAVLHNDGEIEIRQKPGRNPLENMP